MHIVHIRTFGLILLISIISFFTILFYSLENDSKINEAASWVNHTHEVIEKGKSLKFHLFQIENNIRSFYISGNKDFVNNLTADLRLLDSSLNELRQTISYNDVQSANVDGLKELITEKKAQFIEGIDFYTLTKNPLDSGLQKILTKSSALSIEIMAKFETIENLEKELLYERSQALKDTQKGSFLFNFLGGLCALFLASISTIKLLQHLKELKKAKHEIEQKEEKLRIIYNSTSDGLLLLDYNDFKILDCNSAVLNLFEEPTSERFIGQNFFDFGSHGSKKEDKDQIYSLLNSSQTWINEVAFKTKSDEVFWGEVCFSKTIVDDRKRVLARITDITKRKFAEKEVRETSKILDGILDNLPVIVYKLDSIGFIKLLKGKGINALGLDPSKMIGQNIYQYFPNMEQEMGNAYHWSSSVITGSDEKNGREAFLEHYLFQDPDDEGGLVGFALDITANKESEKELIAAKHNAEKAVQARQKFLSTMSHEIRTPLNAIIGMTHLLLQDKLTEQQQKRLKILKFSGENLLNTLNDILDFSKIESGGIDFAKSDFNLNDIIKNTYESFLNLADKKGIQFNLKLDENIPPYVKGDSHRLQQVLNNLLNNAIKFTQEGSVSLSVMLEKESEENFTFSFEVSDTGIGIAPDKLEKIFQPFKQAEVDTSKKFGGTGLGLAIIKNIVELQGGRIDVKSEQGEGSSFTAYLHFEKSLITYNNESIDEELVSLKGVKVLYVEDVAVNQLLLEGFSQLWNVELDVVSSGTEALDQVRRRRYDLILMDIQMPDMDGYETTRRIRTIQGDYYNKIPIVALTAEVSEDIKTKIYRAGMNGYLSKPIVPSELHGMIYKYLPQIGIVDFDNADQKMSTAREETQTIDFETLDKLFIKQKSDYIKFLDSILTDFSKNFREIKTGIKEKDGRAFSEARHKLLSILKIMKTGEVLTILDEIKEEFEAGLFASEKKSISQVNFAYDSLVEGIAKKIELLRAFDNECS